MGEWNIVLFSILSFIAGTSIGYLTGYRNGVSSMLHSILTDWCQGKISFK